MKDFDDVWEDVHSTHGLGKYPNEDVVTFLMKTFGKCPPERVNVLDLGCGAGANTWFLAREGFCTYGIDGSKSAIEKTKAYLKQEKLSAYLAQCPMTNLGYLYNLFDAVIDVRSMSNVPYSLVRSVIREVWLALRPGGYFMTFLYGPSCSGYPLGRKIEPHTYTDIKEGPLAGRGHITIYSEDTIKEVFTGFDFKLIDTHNIITKSLDWQYEETVIIFKKGDGQT